MSLCTRMVSPASRSPDPRSFSEDIIMSSARPCWEAPAELLRFKQGASPWCDSRGKRLFDFACAALILIVFAPLLMVIALLIRLTSAGPALFRQTRVGKDGKEFPLLKFRSMFHDRKHAGS